MGFETVRTVIKKREYSLIDGIKKKIYLPKAKRCLYLIEPIILPISKRVRINNF